MSQKAEKPLLQDEKEKYDPLAFRDTLLSSLQEAGNDLKAVARFLNSAVERLDHKRYAEPLFDILIVGGLLGGSLIDGNDASKTTNTCIFQMEKEQVTEFAGVFTQLIRRYKYLERMFEDEMRKVLTFLKGYESEQRHKLSQAIACWLSLNTLPLTTLTHLLHEHLVKDGIALEFLLDVLETWKSLEPDVSLKTALKKASLDGRLLEFVPFPKRSTEFFQATLREHGLHEVAELQREQATAEVRRSLQNDLNQLMADDHPVNSIIEIVRERQVKHGLEDKEIILLIWGAAMSTMEYSKKEKVLIQNTVRHLNKLAPLFAAFCKTDRAESALMTRVNDFCYEEFEFMRAFQRIVILFYKKNVLSEDTIQKWYKLAKTKQIFKEQMKPFIDWLEYAQEESRSDTESI